jgi:hypothetical protein
VTDELPPLSDTDDPFALLGVAEDADERTLKRAYARLIRIYRPDQAPDEFARIHAAFELARDERGGRLPPTMPPPTSEPTPDDPDTPEPSLADRLIELVEDGRLDDLFLTISHPHLLADAEHDPALASIVLRAAAVLAWRVPAALGIIKRLASSPCARDLPRILDLAEREAVLAVRYNTLRGHYAFDLPAPVFDLLANSLLTSPRGRERTVEQVAALLTDPGPLLATCERIFRLDKGLALAMTERLQLQSPLWSARALAPLSEAVRAELHSGLVAVEPRDHRRLVGLTIAGGAVWIAILVGLIVTGTIVIGKSGNDAMWLLPALGPYALYQYLHRNRYRTFIRARLARVAAELGVQADAIAAWIRSAPRYGRDLRIYEADLRNDAGLALFAAIAALVREHQRGDRLPEVS